MVVMASSFMNFPLYIGLTPGGKPVTKYASSRGLQVKGPTKLNTTKIGAIDWSMLFPKVKTFLFTQRMMLDSGGKKAQNMVPNLDLRRMVKDGFIYRETICIRSYEVGPNQTASIETLMHNLQETALNNMIKRTGVRPEGFFQLDSKETTFNNMIKRNGVMPEGFASAHMEKKNLTWVIAKMQMIVERYPTWGSNVQIDTWNAPYGKIGLLCNYIFSDCKTGEMLVRASSIWVIMNKTTKKISKFPKEVQATLEQSFVDTPPIVKQDTMIWSNKYENIEDHICKGLTPRWSDLDMNQHVNNVKIFGWILESVPKTILENYEIESLALEYYREVTKDTVLQSLTSILVNNNGEIANDNVIDCQHSLQFEVDGGIGDIVMKGKTRWRLRYGKSQESQ